ncbi:hypothetical protein JCM10212_004830 [Sporobolomyces blumeae]
MGRDRLDRLSVREVASDCHPRRDRAQVSNADKLRERRDKREIEDLKAELAALRARATDESAGSGKSEKVEEAVEVRKSLERDVANLEKQLKRVQDEAQAVTKSRDDLSAEVTTLRATLDTDERLVALKTELKDCREQLAKVKARLAATEEEAEAYKTRWRQIEDDRFHPNHGWKHLSSMLNAEEFRSMIEDRERDVARVTREKAEANELLKVSKKRIEVLEKRLRSAEQQCARLVSSQAEAPEKSEAAPVPCCEHPQEVKKLTKENEGLQETVKDLTKRCDYLSKKKLLPASSGADPASTTVSHRYAQLVENLNVTEEDVTLLLQSGPFWPPIRGSLPESSLIDLLWILNDQESEAKEDKASWSAEKRELEEKLERAKSSSGELAGPSSSSDEVKATVGDSVEVEENLRTALSALSVKFAAESAQRQKELDGKDEAIRVLEDKLEKVSQAAEQCNGLDDASSTTSQSQRSSGPTAASGSSTPSSASSPAFVKHALKTISTLNAEIAHLRQENTSLLEQLAEVA